MKHSVLSFLDVLKEATFDLQEDEPTIEFTRGVEETIEMAKVWFESNNVTDIDIDPQDYIE